MGNGECGRCCGVVNHFIMGCPGGVCGGQGHCNGYGGAGGELLDPSNGDGGHGGYNGGSNVTRQVGKLVKNGKGMISKFFK
jgi:hypothetical protein